MTPELQRFVNLPYKIHVVPDSGTYGEQQYFATVAELPGCESHGTTPEEAIRNVRDAMALYISSLLEDGLMPPEPDACGIGAVWSVHPQSHRPRVSADNDPPEPVTLAA